jgi:hypothetical protein
MLKRFLEFILIIFEIKIINFENLKVIFFISLKTLNKNHTIMLKNLMIQFILLFKILIILKFVKIKLDSNKFNLEKIR